MKGEITLTLRFPRDILMHRLRKFQTLIKEKNIDAVMLRTLSSFIYFTGIKWLRPALLIPADGDPIAFVANGEEEGFLEKTWIKDVITYAEGGEVMAKVSGRVREEGYRVVGLEFGIERDAYILFYEMFKRLNPKVKVVDVSELIYELRMIKDNYELDSIRKAGEIASKAMEHVLSVIRIGMSETEIAAEIYHKLYNYGCEEPHVYVNVGPHPRIHSEPMRDNTVKDGVFVTIIIGADYNHYYTNMARTIYIGKPNDKAEKALKCMDDVYDLAHKLTKAGVKPVDVMKEIEKIYAKHGLLSHRVKGYLHGVGLQVEEPPITTIVPKHRFIELKTGMVVAFVHAPTLIKGLGQVKKEDTFIINARGEPEKVTMKCE